MTTGVQFASGTGLGNVTDVSPTVGLPIAGVAGQPVPVTYTANKLEWTTRTPLWATGQVLTTSATSAASTAITGTEVMISCTQDCWIKIGAATPTAAKDTAGSMFLAKGGPYTFQMTTGQLVAAVQDSAAGKVSILPVA